MRSIIGASKMVAMIFSSPPQFGHPSRLARRLYRVGDFQCGALAIGRLAIDSRSLLPLQRIVMSRQLPLLSKRCAFAIMAKASTPGRVKTRLVPPLTMEAAAAWNTCFLADACENILTAANSVPIDGYVAYAALGFEAFFRANLPLGMRRCGRARPPRGRASGPTCAGGSETIQGTTQPCRGPAAVSRAALARRICMNVPATSAP